MDTTILGILRNLKKYIDFGGERDSFSLLFLPEVQNQCDPN